MGHEKNTTVGLLGILGIWLTAGLALPLVNILGMFSPAQLMVFRGFFTALMAFVFIRGVPWKVDRYTYLMAIVLPFATFGLYQGIRAWGAGPTIIILTATPLINLAFGLLLGRRISVPLITGLVLVLVGVVMARWGGHFVWTGFLWSSFATLMSATVYELFARAKSGPMQKCFWSCLGMGVLGSALSVGDNWSAAGDPWLLAFLAGFAFVGGFLYWIANLVAFENLPTTEASVLAQGETPAVILGAYLLLGEHLTVLQWAGVGVSLYGAWHLSRWLKKQEVQDGSSG